MRIKGLVFVLAAMICFFLAEESHCRVEVPGRTDRFINDYAGVLDSDTKDYLEKLASSVKQPVLEPVEVIVATFKSLEGRKMDEFARAYGERWRESKLGERDNGVILLLEVEEGRIMIGAGQNLRSIFTREIQQDIIKAVESGTREQGISEGIKQGTELIVKILDEAEIPTGNTVLIVRIFLVAAIVFGIPFFILSKKKIPSENTKS